MSKEGVQDVLSNLSKIVGNEFAGIASDGTLGDVESYTDTGCYILNAQLSGSLNGGLPNGQSLMIAGQSTTGKTYFSLSIAKQFLKKHKEGVVFIFDSENAINKERLEARGMDTDRIGYVAVSSLFQFKHEATKLLTHLNKTYDVGEKKFLIILDSLGNLASSKELGDALDGNDKVDMSRAKETRSVFRTLLMQLYKHSIPLVVTNHVYTEVGFIPRDVVGGGGGAKYSPDYTIMLTKAKEKDTQGNVIGGVITSTAVKNRDAKENTKIKMLLSYERGLHPYYGLLPHAVEAGIIEKDGTKYSYKEKKYTEKQIYKNGHEIFDADTINELDKYIGTQFKYGNTEEDDEVFVDPVKKKPSKKEVAKQ